MTSAESVVAAQKYRRAVIAGSIVVVVLLLIALVMAFGPKTAADADADASALPIDAGRAVSLPVKAGDAATLLAADGAVLTLPPGGLSTDTTITVTVPTDQRRESTFLVYSLLPTGTRFAKPVRLTIPYADLPSGPPQLVVFESSTANPLARDGSESSNWRFANVVARDFAARTITVELEHFTFVYAGVQVDDNGYLVTDIPPKYLKPGDLLFTLTSLTGGGPNWAPGHVGLSLGTFDRPGQIIESTSVDSGDAGVRLSSMSVFARHSGHLFLGARRPGGGYTEAQRVTMSTFLKDQVGASYGLTGDDLATVVATGKHRYSCVSLALKALQLVGKDPLNAFQHASVPTPLELFRRTVPVQDIALEVGETLEVPVSGVVVHPDSPYVLLTFRGWYGSRNLYEMEATQMPPAATFTGDPQNGFMFSWTPGPAHAGLTFSATFHMTAQPTATVNGIKIFLDKVDLWRTLFITVAPRPVSPSPQIPTDTPGAPNVVVNPPFGLGPAPVPATGTFTNGQGGCGVATSFTDRFAFQTTNGQLTIRQPSTGDVVSGPIEPDGTFHLKSAGEQYDGRIIGNTVVAHYSYRTANGCVESYDATFILQR